MDFCKIIGIFFFSSFFLIATPLFAVVYSRECDMSFSVSNASSSNLIIKKIDGVLVDSFLTPKSTLERLSKVCSIAGGDENEYTKESSLHVRVRHKQTSFRPRVYRWDEASEEWKSVLTTMDRTISEVTADLPISTKYVAVFADTRETYEGVASWYRHKRYPLGSATNIFPIGTPLLVTNRDNGKTVKVTVTSTWTNTDKRRVIDLVRTAFEKIASPTTGLIPVTIERVSNL